MLPVKTTVEDISAIAAYLRSKPAGATVTEAEAALGSSPVDGRKLSAYEQWDIVRNEGGRLYLTDRGRRIAMRPHELPDVLRGLIGRIAAYQSAIEWGYHQKVDAITVDDIAALWHQHHRLAVGTESETSLKAMVTCFFNIADGAGLGTYYIGRRGQETRVELDKAAVEAFIEGGPVEPPWTESESPSDEAAQIPTPPEVIGPTDDSPHRTDEVEGFNRPLKVFISHGQNMDIVEQVETILGLADIPKEVAVKQETAAVPVPKKVMDAMRRCTAGIICVSVDEGLQDGDGNFTVNPNVLIEIGAAFVLYDERVVLLWDKRLKVPSNLQGLYRCEFEGVKLDWDAGTKLMKAIQSFKT